MKSTRMLAILTSALGALVVLSQTPPAAPRTGPGVQAPQDAKYADLIKTCKTPPPPGRGGGAKGKKAGLDDGEGSVVFQGIFAFI